MRFKYLCATLFAFTIFSPKTIASDFTVVTPPESLVLRFLATPDSYAALVNASMVCKSWRALCADAEPWTGGCINPEAAPAMSVTGRHRYVSHHFWQRGERLYATTIPNEADTPEDLGVKLADRAKAFQLYVYAAMGGHSLAQIKLGYMALNEEKLECVSSWQVPQSLASFYRSGIVPQYLTCGDERIDRIFNILLDPFDRLSEVERSAAKKELAMLKLETLSVPLQKIVGYLIPRNKIEDREVSIEEVEQEKLYLEIFKSLLHYYTSGSLTTEVEQFYFATIAHRISPDIFSQEMIAISLTNLLKIKANCEILHFALYNINDFNYVYNIASLTSNLDSLNCLNLLSAKQASVPNVRNFGCDIYTVYTSLKYQLIRDNSSPSRTDVDSLCDFIHRKIGMAIANPSLAAHGLLQFTFDHNEELREIIMPEQSLKYQSRQNTNLITNSFNLLFSFPLAEIISHVSDGEDYYKAEEVIDCVRRQMNVCYGEHAGVIPYYNVLVTLNTKHFADVSRLAHQVCEYLEPKEPIQIACLRSVMLWNDSGFIQDKQAAFDLLAETEVKFRDDKGIRKVKLYEHLLDICKSGWNGLMPNSDEQARYAICGLNPTCDFDGITSAFVDHLRRLAPNSQVARDYLASPLDEMSRRMLSRFI